MADTAAPGAAKAEFPIFGIMMPCQLAAVFGAHRRTRDASLVCSTSITS
jgi:hypothetical protein